MESSTPLTRCSTCQTVFEVPQSILDSIDSRVRCGECLTIFDASENLHLVDRPDLTIPEPTAEKSTDENQSGRSHWSTGVAGPAGAALLVDDFEEFTSDVTSDVITDSATVAESESGQGDNADTPVTAAEDHDETTADLSLIHI